MRLAGKVFRKGYCTICVYFYCYETMIRENNENIGDRKFTGKGYGLGFVPYPSFLFCSFLCSALFKVHDTRGVLCAPFH